MKMKMAAALPLVAAALLLPAGSAMADEISAGGTPLAVGDPISGTLSSATSTLQASNTTITCTASTASGTVSTNPGTGNTTDVTGAISSLSFSGTAGPPGSNRCTTNNSTYTTATASVAIPGGGLGATADAQGTAGPDGSFTVSGVSATVTMYPVSGSTVNCTYTGSVTGGVDNSTSKVTFSAQALTKTGGPFVCPANGATFNATYLLQSGGVNIALN